MYLKSLIIVLLLVLFANGQDITGGPERPASGVRLYLEHDTDNKIVNFTVLVAGDFVDTQDNILWCQSANNGTMIGEWYSPNGNLVTDNGSPLHDYHVEGQVGLLRTGGLMDNVGLCRCVIPDENNVSHTQWVGIYRGMSKEMLTTEIVVEGNTNFSLLTTSRDADPPVFTLSFTVTNLPPSTVVCEVDGTLITMNDEDLDRNVLDSEDPVNVSVTVTISSRQSGSYQCGVTALGADQAPTPNGTRKYNKAVNITVTDAPINLMTMRNGFAQAVIDWFPPNTNNSLVQGYEVFYDLPSGTRLSEDVGSDTTLTVYSLNPQFSYPVLVIAYGGDLPSSAVLSNITEAFSLSVPSESRFMFGEVNIRITCTLNINVDVVALDLVWINNTAANTGDDIANSTSFEVGSGGGLLFAESTSLSLDLTADSVSITDAGVYVCGSVLMDSLGEAANISENHAVFVEVPRPNISINVDPDTTYGRTFITGDGNILCTAVLPAILDVPVNVSFTWWGPDGQITGGEKYLIEESVFIDEYTVISHLIIHSLEQNDNLTMYYCSVEVGIETSGLPSNSLSDFVIPSTATSENTTLIFEELPVPVLSIKRDGGPIIGMNFTITCNAVFNETIASISFQWLVNGSAVYRNGVLLSDDNSSLTVTDISLSDEGTYTCIGTLDIAEIPNNTVSSATYDFSTLDDPVVVISVSGSNVAGGMYSLTCTVTVVTGVPNITWTDPDGIKVDDSLLTLTTNGDISTLVLAFQSLDYTDIGEYMCTASLNVSEVNFLGMSSDTTIVDIQIPTPSVTVTPVNLTFIRGTERSITCNVTLNTPSPMNPVVTLDWTKDGIPFDNTTDRVIEGTVIEAVDDSVYSSTIRFSPLNSTDHGSYECTVTVGPEVMDEYIINSSATGTYSLAVTDFPDPIITLSTSGSGIVNDDYSLTCNVTVAEGLIGFLNNLTIEKMTDNGYQVLDYSTGTTLTVDLSPLTTADGGMYRCSYDTRQDTINYQRRFEELINLAITIPQPTVQLTTDPTSVTSLIEGTYIDLVCNASISDGVDTVISVTVEWLRNGTAIVNGTDYSISELNLVNGYYISTVRIQELKTSDNNAVITCSVTATPIESTFIIGNNASDDFTLIVRDIQNDDITVDIIFPTVPTAGDQFNITCTATVPERLVHSPDTFLITYDLSLQMIVADDNPDATQSSVSRSGNVFTRVVTIDPVKTSDAEMYYCTVTFVDLLGTSVMNNKQLQVHIPTPAMSSSLSPDGIIYESTLLVITCNASLPNTVDTDVSATVSWTGPNGIVNSNGRITVGQPDSVDDNVFQSVLTFEPVDNGDIFEGTNDAGMYTCEMTISSSLGVPDVDKNMHILSASNNITEDIAVAELPGLKVSVSTSGSTEVGQSLNITCSVELVEGLVGGINITWEKMDDVSELEDLNIPIRTVVDGPVTNVTLMLDPVQFNYRGVYMCIAMYNVSQTHDGDSDSSMTTLTVDFPPFDVTLSQDRTDPLYTGTSLNISCDIILSSLVDIPVNITNQWTRNGTAIMESTITEDLITKSNLSYTATLEFFPLYHITDDGEYQCSVSVAADVSSQPTYIRDTSNDDSATIDVLDLPDPIVNVSRSSLNPSVDDPFEFVCSVSVVDDLIVSPEISWSKYVSSVNNPLPEDDISVDPVLSDDELSLDFISLNTSDAGRYTCDAVLTFSQINVTRSSNDYETLTLQIPTPEVSVTRSKTGGSLLAGSQLTLYCDITVDTNVDTQFIVSTTWTRTDGSNNVEALQSSSSNRVTVYDPYSTGFNRYQSRIEFSTLSSLSDSGIYTCQVFIDSDSDYVFVYDSSADNDTTNVQVIDPMISNLYVDPNSFLGLATFCSDSDPYDTFVLNCSATKPSIVIPELEVFWTRDGIPVVDNSVTYNRTLGNDTDVLTTLIFPTSNAGDSGTYVCTSRLVIPESTNISVNGQSDVTIRAATLPNAAINPSIAVSTRSVTVTFTVPSIAYTPEIYHVTYTGLELQNYTVDSRTVNGTDNITAENLVYNIMLTGLEEANTYNFTIVSTNCVGETRTMIGSFTTDPAAPSGIVRDCQNTTFNPRDVTLSWEPPVRVDQNGEITGYRLLCQEEGSPTPVPNTNETSDSVNTTYTIPVITPFRSFNCAIAAINSEGVGPLTFCLFDSAQDAPSDPPQSFASVPEQFTVNFTWSAPSTPNGIITTYNLTVTKYSTATSTTREGTTSSTISYDVPGTDNYYIVSDFLAYQRYTATITARTTAGYGPETEIDGRTDPDVSSEVILTTFDAPIPDTQTLLAIDETTLNVTWRPPNTPNGNISSYRIDVQPDQAPELVTAVDEQPSYTYRASDLRIGVPYTITIGAINELGVGRNVSVIAFTGILESSVSPENVGTVRSVDGTQITVTWDLVLLEDAHGFYRTVVFLSSDLRKRQDISMSVYYPETSVTFSDLEPSDSYAVTAMIETLPQDGGDGIEGPTSAPVIQEPNDEHTREPSSPDIVPIIIAVVVSVVGILLLVIVVVIIIVYMYYRKRQRKGSVAFGNDLFELSSPNAATILRQLNEPSDIDDNEPNGRTSGTSFSPLRNEEGAAEDDEEDPKKKLMEEDMAYLEAEKSIDRSKPIAKTSFHEHVQLWHEDADKEFEAEYKSVPNATEASIESGKSDENKAKNRFANIFPYDHSRVKLSTLEDSAGSDYINASYVDGYNRKDCYVCAQGPLPTTVGDFWRMIWENRITNIVMLTGVVEGGKKKCEQYWPDTIGEAMDTQGGLKVSMASKVPFSDYTIHSLKVSKPDTESATSLDVTHFHFTAWPDHGVPQFATSLIGFINRVQKAHDKTKGVPLLVHCSAGVGRTGTFVMLDTMMDRLRVEDSLNVYEFLKEMREKRMYMVQTLAQYVFIHDALDEYLTCGETDIPVTNLKVRVSKMHKMVPSKNISGFQEQFQLLEQVCYVPNESAYSDATKPFNTVKNRYPEIVPLNLNRPRLRPDGSDGSDYINASCVDGYKYRNAYLVTQGPLKNTVDDFWRMIVEFKSRSIVMLCNTVEEGEEKCHMYWPTKEGEPVEYGKHKVTLQSETPSDQYIIRKILIQNEKSSQKAEREGIVVTQFHYTQWPEHGHPSITGQILEMIDMITRNQMNTNNKPITVVCNDGVGRSGAFLCIHSQLERLKTEGEVDVFKYLKSARTKRVGLVSETDHYVFIHEVLADYIDLFDPYSNFKN